MKCISIVFEKGRRNWNWIFLRKRISWMRLIFKCFNFRKILFFFSFPDNNWNGNSHALTQSLLYRNKTKRSLHWQESHRSWMRANVEKQCKNFCFPKILNYSIAENEIIWKWLILGELERQFDGLMCKLIDERHAECCWWGNGSISFLKSTRNPMSHTNDWCWRVDFQKERKKKNEIVILCVF